MMSNQEDTPGTHRSPFETKVRLEPKPDIYELHLAGLVRRSFSVTSGFRGFRERPTDPGNGRPPIRALKRRFQVDGSPFLDPKC